MTKFGCHVIVLAYFWYFKLIFIFRGPIYGLFELFTNIWQPWKWNLTSYYCSGSLKTHESEFYFSGLPNFDNQGCHISLGRNCTNSIPAQDNGQITSLKHPTVGIHGKFCCTFFQFGLDCGYIFLCPKFFSRFPPTFLLSVWYALQLIIESRHLP